jgi:hypothetical protein
MMVDFVTDAPGASVVWGTSPTSLTSTAAVDSEVVTLNTWTSVMNQGRMTGLEAGTKYYFTVGSDKDGWSGIYDFTAAPTRPGGTITAVLADFGLVNDESLPFLMADALSGGFDTLVHAGEWRGWGGLRGGAKRALLAALTSTPQS